MTNTKELRRLLAESTPGEWKLLASPSGCQIGDDNGSTVAFVPAKRDGRTFANGSLIFSLRNAAPELLDRLERAEQLLSLAAEMEIPSSLQRAIADFLAPNETP